MNRECSRFRVYSRACYEPESPHFLILDLDSGDDIHVSRPTAAPAAIARNDSSAITSTGGQGF
jgi:hypothetical protein